MRCVQRRILRWYDKNSASLNFWNLTNDAPWILLIRGPGIRVPSSAPKSHEESYGSSWDFLFIRHLHGLCTVFARSAFFVSDGVSLWITLQSVLFFAIQVSRARRSCAFTEGSASFRSSSSADTEMVGSASTGVACTGVVPVRPSHHRRRSSVDKQSAGCAMESLNSTKACWSPDVKKKR